MLSWTKRLFARPVRSSVQTYRRPNSRMFRPAVEELESRVVPTNQTFTLNLLDQTGLSPNYTATNNVWVGGFAGPYTSGGVHYGYQLNSGGTFQSYNAGSSPQTDLTFYKLSSVPSVTLSQQLTAGRLILAYGASPTVPFVQTGGGLYFPQSPTPSTLSTEPYDFVEFTLNQAGEAPSSSPIGLFLNTTQVDQFGFPITVSGADASGNTQAVGITPGVTRDQVMQGYTNYLGSTSPWATLVVGPTTGYQYRIVSPGNASNFDWDTSFNDPIRQLFEKSYYDSSNIANSALRLLQATNGLIYTGQPVQFNPGLLETRALPTAGNLSPSTSSVTMPTLPNGASYQYAGNNYWYNALEFTATGGTSLQDGPYFVFEPYWQQSTAVDIEKISITNGTAVITTDGNSGVVHLGPSDFVTVQVSGAGMLLPDNQYQVTKVDSPTQFEIAVPGVPNGSTLDAAGTVYLSPTQGSPPVTTGAQAPSWIANSPVFQGGFSPGRQVLQPAGVFADNGTPSTPGQVNDPNSEDGYQIILAALENQLVTALNRGVSTENFHNYSSSAKTVSDVSFTQDSHGNNYAVITTATPHGLAPSLGEYVTMKNLPATYGGIGVTLNGTFSPSGVLGPYTYEVALPPGTYPSSSQSFAIPAGDNATEQLSDSAGGSLGVFDNSTQFWSDGNNFYPAGAVDNGYADALHNMTVIPTTGPYAGQSVPAFINKQVYALSYDDQGGNSPSVFFSTPGSQPIAVTLDNWGPPPSSTAPSPPANLTATAGNAQVKLTWANVADATSYQIFRGNSGPGSESSTPIATVPEGTSPPAIFTFFDNAANDPSNPPQNGQTYYYYVEAVNSVGASQPSNQAGPVTPSPSVPSAPTNLTATPGNHQVSLSWTAPPGTGLTYNVYRGDSGPGSETDPPIVSGLTITNYTDGSAANGFTYYYVVRAVNSAGESQDSNEAHATPEQARQQTVGVFHPATGNWYLRNSNSAGAPDIGPFAYGAPGWYPIVGDWNGDGVTTIGVVDLSTETWYLRDSNSAGAPSYTPFQYGAPGWIPVAGDWNHSGHTGIGVFDPSTGNWYLRTEVGPGAPDAGQFQYGGANWKPVVGDWTGQGKDTVGVVNPATETWYLRNSNSAGAPDFAPFAYGAPGWTPVAGDWTGIGHSGVGVFDPNGNWYLRTEVGAGGPDAGQFQYGGAGWGAVVGTWASGLPLTASGPGPGTSTLLTQQQLNSEVQVALQELQAAGAMPATLAELGSASFVVGQLPGNTLGYTYLSTHQVVIDAGADGWGWFVEQNPRQDSYFVNGVAQFGTPAVGHMDLLTTVLHEMGHVLGLSDLDLPASSLNVMNDVLAPGTRHLSNLDAFFSGSGM